MNIKDFEVGQEVYSLLEKDYRNTNDKIDKVTVMSVGRKYVTTSSMAKYYHEDKKNEYLLENKDYGDRKKFFISEQAVNNYVERKSLFRELRKKFDWHNEHYFTLEQLRAIKRIMEEGESK